MSGEYGYVGGTRSGKATAGLYLFGQLADAAANARRAKEERQSNLAGRYPDAIDVQAHDITQLIEQERRQLRAEQVEAERQASIRRKGAKIARRQLR